jgi:hypothetical protein
MPNVPAKPYPQMAAECRTWKIGNCSINKHGSKAFYIQNQNTPGRPKYQLVLEGGPRLRAPFGCNDGPPGKDGTPKPPTDRKGMVYSLEDQALIDVLKQVDDYMLEWGRLNARAIFGREVSAEFVGMMYKALVRVKEPDEKTTTTYAPTLNTKANTAKDSKFPTRFFACEELEQGKIVYERKDWQSAKPNCMTVPIVEISGVWASSQGFGLTVETTDCMIFPPQEREENPFMYNSLVDKSTVSDTTSVSSSSSPPSSSSSSSSSSSASPVVPNGISSVLLNPQTQPVAHPEEQDDEPFDGDEEDGDVSLEYTPAATPA